MKNIQELLDKHKRLIESEAAKYAQFVPYPSVLAEAYKIANKAAQTYDEKKGVKFSTYLHHALRKLSKISTRYGSIVRVPEAPQYKIHRLNQVEQELKEELGRNPTVLELSSRTGMSVQEISNLLQNRKKEVNINNLPFTPVFIESKDDWLYYVYHDLPEKDRFIFEHKTGFGNRKIMSNEEIAKALNIPVSTVARRIKIISNRIMEGLK